MLGEGQALAMPYICDMYGPRGEERFPILHAATLAKALHVRLKVGC